MARVIDNFKGIRAEQDPLWVRYWQLSKVITGPMTARAFLRALVLDGLMFHPDDDAVDCIGGHPLVRAQPMMAYQVLQDIQKGMDLSRVHLTDVYLTCLELLGEPSVDPVLSAPSKPWSVLD